MRPLFSIFVLFASFCQAQISENFSDGNFLSNPSWQGDDSLFQINSAFQLQSNGTIAKDISLSTPSTIAQGEWRFWCRFNVSPSTANFMRVYLISDSANLKTSLNGYYVQLGGVTGTTDSITLYKQSGTLRTRIIAGRPSTVSKSNNLVSIKVLRDIAGNWQLFSDTTGGQNYVLEGTGIDSTFTHANFFGVVVKYTSTNAQRYYLDNIYTGPIIMDTIAPVVDSIQVITPTQLRLVFSENIESISALNTFNYNINNAIGSPVSAQYDGSRKDVVLLDLNTILTVNNYVLTANNISDDIGNITATQQVPFGFYRYDAEFGDVLISEFFPDPTPSVGLPEDEFIELYNHTNITLQLKGWTISDASTTITLPDFLIGPDSFIILCAASNIILFRNFGNCISTSLPSLNNTSDQLILKDNTGKIIHQLNYDMSWYGNELKADGGYTIEMNNPNQLCLGKQNYKASDNLIGGTPGTKNSRWAFLNDTIAPLIFSVSATNDKTVQLVFNEKMDSVSMLNAAITFAPTNTIVSRFVNQSNMDTLIILLANQLTSNSTHTLTISNAADCKGNLIVPNTLKQFSYFVPDTASQFDVLINEILPDPEPIIGLPAAEYIELYNRSNKIISLFNWTISDASLNAKLPNTILLPDSFIILTSQTNISLFTSFQNAFGLSNFPSLGNDGDVLTLKNETGKVIHTVVYNSNWHINKIKQNGGWSLEMIDTKNPCGGISNWTSSTNTLGGTLGKKNSVTAINRDKTAPKLLRAYPLSANQLTLYFNEPMDSISMMPLHRFLVNNTIGNVVATIFDDATFQSATISLNMALVTNTIYRIIVDSVKDCAGNSISNEDYADVGLPEKVDSFDFAINEVLFNPRVNGVDFVELINRSDKILDLKNMFIANTTDDNAINDFYPIVPNGFIVLPKQYIVLTENIGAIQSDYFTPQPKHIIECQMPSFNDDKGSCVFIDLFNKRYDQFNYDEDIHFKLIDEKEGVSLERIDFNRPTMDKSNWTSASSTSGYATPTYQNSQYSITTTTQTIKAEPDIFSPDGDGYNDVVNFSYLMNEPGFTANFYIYNSAGQQVKYLVRNQLLGSNGVFSWDGITDEGTKAPIGIYVCYFETFNLHGEVNKQKISIVVAAKL